MILEKTPIQKSEILSQTIEQKKEELKQMQKALNTYNEELIKSSIFKKIELILILQTIIKMVENKEFKLQTTKIYYQECTVDCYETNYTKTSTNIQYLSKNITIPTNYENYQDAIKQINEFEKEGLIIKINLTDKNILEHLDDIVLLTQIQNRLIYKFNFIAYPYITPILNKLIELKYTNPNITIEELIDAITINKPKYQKIK